MSNPIYTIVTFENIKEFYREDGTSYKYRPSKVLGYLYDKDQAIALVKANATDMYEEGYYPLVVVERVSEGFYGINPNDRDNRHDWFQWNTNTNQYEEIDEPPEDLKCIVTYSLG